MRTVPGEMKSFSDFDFPDVIRQNIELSKYLKPTPIQKHALPVAFMGRDVMACAQTGSGSVGRDEWGNRRRRGEQETARREREREAAQLSASILFRTVFVAAL